MTSVNISAIKTYKVRVRMVLEIESSVVVKAMNIENAHKMAKEEAFRITQAGDAMANIAPGADVLSVEVKSEILDE